MWAIVLIGGGGFFLAFFLYRVFKVQNSKAARELKDTIQNAEVKEDSYEQRQAKDDRKYRVFLRQVLGIIFSSAAILIGVFLICSGRGGNLLGKINEVQSWDDINEDGKYVDEDNNEYSYYIVLTGEKILLCGEQCADLEDLRERLTDIRRENTIMLVDSYSMASLYHDTEHMLNELDIKYKTVEK